MAGGSTSLGFVFWPLIASIVALGCYFMRTFLADGLPRLAVWWGGTLSLVLAGALLWMQEGEKGFLHTVAGEFRGDAPLGAVFRDAAGHVSDATVPFTAFVMLAVAAVGVLSGLAFSVEDEGRRGVRALVWLVVSAMVGGFVALYLSALGFSATA